MTLREYMKKNHPDAINDAVPGGVSGCPSHYGLGPDILRCGELPEIFCTQCWDREMPEEISISEAVSNVGTSAKEAAEAFEKTASAIKDSGDRTEFKSGAVRDMHEGKGRCDLMPLDVVGDILNNAVFNYIYNFQKTGDISNLRVALLSCGLFSDIPDSSANYIHTMFLEVAKHFEEGCKKYGENNWRKGIPVKCYIDSAVRHYLKYLRGDKDEPHDRAFCWNILCCIWTVNNIPGALEESGYGTSV